MLARCSSALGVSPPHQPGACLRWRFAARRVQPAGASAAHARQQYRQRSVQAQRGAEAELDACHTATRRSSLLGLALAPLALAALPFPSSASIVEEGVVTRIFQQASPSVVSIAIFKTVAGGLETFEGVGTGVVWDEYGHVVTNYHCVSRVVLDRASQVIKVGFTDQAGGQVSFPAVVVGTDAQHDLAVLLPAGEVPRALLRPLPLGSSAGLKVGQTVVAIGNPYGLTQTLSAGVVSGLGRTIPAPTGTRISGAIQTDASINAGNSGGPLLDSGGRLVGLNTATFTRAGTGRGSGVNFALPADLLRASVPNLIVYGNAAGKM